MHFRIRTATADDVPAMHRIRMAVFENRLRDPALVTEPDYLPFVAAGSAWVANCATGPAGFAAVDLADGNIWALFVEPRSEGCGIGRALHEAMLDKARALGLARLWLTTAPGTRAQRFYLRAGWRRAGPAPGGDLRFERVL
jgi:GNAT superfamily N-acetyltransferase